MSLMEDFAPLIGSISTLGNQITADFGEERLVGEAVQWASST